MVYSEEFLEYTVCVGLYIIVEAEEILRDETWEALGAKF